MDHSMGSGMFSPFGSGVAFIVITFLLILAILWFFLPFAIFGTKAKLNDLKLELESTNKNLQLILEELKNHRPNSTGNEEQLPTINASRD